MRRAAAADLVGSLATTGNVMQARALKITDDECNDASRLVSQFSKPALALLCSNGVSDTKVPGDTPTLILTIRSWLVGRITHEILQPLGAARARNEAAAAKTLAEGLVCGDVEYKEAVRLFGGHASTQKWASLSSGPYAGGVTGSTTGDRAQADCEQAMSSLGKLLHTIFVDSFNCPQHLTHRAYVASKLIRLRPA